MFMHLVQVMAIKLGCIILAPQNSLISNSSKKILYYKLSPIPNKVDFQLVYINVNIRGLVSFLLFNGISTSCGLFNGKTILVKEQQWYYLTPSWGIRKLNIFSKGISLKVNVVAWIEFELTHFKVAIQHFSHYAKGTPKLEVGSYKTFLSYKKTRNNWQRKTKSLSIWIPRWNTS